MKRTPQAEVFKLKVEFSREDDGRWIADIPALPGVTVITGRTRKQALTAAEALVLLRRDRSSVGPMACPEPFPGEVTVVFSAA